MELSKEELEQALQQLDKILNLPENQAIMNQLKNK